MVSAVRSHPGIAVSDPAEGQAPRDITRALPEEWPVALVYEGSTLAVMMASPQDLEDFALGFSLTEGVIDSLEEVADFEVVAHEAGTECRFWLRGNRGAALAARRRAMAGPVGCGLCGIDSLEAATRPLPVLTGGPSFTAAEIAAGAEALRGHQPLHDQTRAVHAAGFLLPGQGLVMAREDVGRHNALDKLLGALARAGIKPSSGAIVMTSRLSVELVQKAAMTGCRVMVAVSAPTAHALRLAEGAGITVAAFARAVGFDLYAHPERIRTGDAHVA